MSKWCQSDAEVIPNKKNFGHFLTQKSTFLTPQTDLPAGRLAFGRTARNKIVSKRAPKIVQKHLNDVFKCLIASLGTF